MIEPSFRCVCACSIGSSDEIAGNGSRSSSVCGVWWTATAPSTTRSERGQMTADLNGKVAMITGGGRGIGRATAIQLAEAGAYVTVCARTASEVGSATAEHPSLTGIVGDVSDPDFVQRLVGSTVSKRGRMDILINNAAMLGRATIQDLEPDLWDRVMAVNLRGAYFCSRAAFQQMSRQDPPGGSIVNLGSLSGVRGPEKFPGLAAYNVSKAGVIALSDILAMEGKPYDIR